MSKVTDCCESVNYLRRKGKNGTYYVCEHCYHTCDLKTVKQPTQITEEVE